MAFWRVRGQSISLLHGQRTGSSVRQSLLHTFSSWDDLAREVQPEHWSRFVQSIEQAHPKVAPRWSEVRAQALELLKQAPSPAPPAEDLTRVRKALRYAARALYASPVRPVDHRLTQALAPELFACLEAGLMRIHGHDHPAIALLVPNQEKTDALVEKARAAFPGNPQTGQSLFEKAQSYNPYDPDVLNSWGNCLFQQGQFDAAQGLYEKARELARLQIEDKVYSWQNLRIRPYLRATANLAMVLAKQGRYQEALDLNLHCLELCPDNGVAARSRLGNLYQRLGRLEEALQAMREDRSDTPEAYYDRTRILLKLAREGEAERWALRALAGNPMIPVALSARLSSGCYEADDYAAECKDLWSRSEIQWLTRFSKRFPTLKVYRQLWLEDAPAGQLHRQASLLAMSKGKA